MKHIELFENDDKKRPSIYELVAMSDVEAAEFLFHHLEHFSFEDEELIKDIFEYSNIDVNYRDDEKMTLIMYCAWDDRKFTAAQLMKDPKIDVNIQDNRGMTALMYAIDGFNDEIAKNIIQHPNTDLNVKNKKNGKTALLYALENNRSEVIEILLESPNINLLSEDSDGKGAWDYADIKTAMKYPALQFGCKWENDGTSLTRVFNNLDFYDAISFIDSVAEIAMEEDHHPNIELFDYNKVRITYSTHSVNKVTTKDYICSKKIDEQYGYDRD
jgi:pterin-4a-carbinolamine dehydratase